MIETITSHAAENECPPSFFLHPLRAIGNRFGVKSVQKKIAREIHVPFRCSNVSLSKGNFKLQPLSFELPAGSSLALFGASGSGKTLLLRAIAGLENIESGEISFQGERIDTIRPSERSVAFVFQNFALYPHLSARENILYPEQHTRTKNKPAIPSADFITHELGISDHDLNRLPKELSLGIRQLIAIAREKNRNTDLFLLDEPMSRLDAHDRIAFTRLLISAVRDNGITSILSLNDPSVALSLCDFIAVLENGKLVQFGPIREVYENPVSQYVMEELSTLGLNIIPVEVTNGKSYPLNIEADVPDGKYTLCFRPEDIHIDGTTQALITHRSFIDNLKALVECRTIEGTEVSLLVDAETPNGFTFTIERFRLFN